MAKVGLESADVDEIQPQHVTYYDLSPKHVHWDRVTMVVLTSCAVTFWAWGKHVSNELTSSTNVMLERSSVLDMNARPETVALAALPQPLPQLERTRGSLSFIEPELGSTVGATLSVRGVVRGVAEGRHLWLVTRRDGQSGFWPKERVIPDDDGAFQQTTWDYGPDGRMSLCLMSTTDVDTTRFEAWLAVGDRDDEWPALEAIAASTVLGCQEVKLAKHTTDVRDIGR